MIAGTITGLETRLRLHQGTLAMSGSTSSPLSLLRNPFLWASLIVLAGVFVTLSLLGPRLRRGPAPPPVIAQLPSYELVDQRGQPFGSAELTGDVYVANFIFTRCSSICPLLTRAMALLQERLDERGIAEIKLVSFTVDPEYDTPPRLQAYAETHGADPQRWTFVTGDPERITQLIEKGFTLGVGAPEMHGESLIEIAHSGKFVLVDGSGGIRGYYDSDVPGHDEALRSAIRVFEHSR
jgi:protein SCO1/2